MLYRTFMDELPFELHVHFNMYHSMTLEGIKADIREDMTKADGMLRVLFATNAAGMV